MATGRLPDPNTAPVTAKGDLYTYSTVPAKLAVGNNGETLVADSSATTGLRWQGSFEAGKNKIINGNFGIWQRGTSFTPSAGVATYTADRWRSVVNSGTTISRQTFTPGTAPVAGYEGQFYFNATITANNQNYEHGQFIEDARTFAGQTVTLSFWARSTVGAQGLNVALYQNFGTGGSPSSLTQVGSTVTYTPTSSWQRFIFTFDVPSISGKTFGTNNDSYFWVRTAQYTTTATNTSIDIWGVQLEAGSVATPFQTATGTLAGELAACQRYYARETVTVGGSGVYLPGISGVAISTTIGDINVTHPTTMRIAPTSIETGVSAVYDWRTGAQHSSGTFTLYTAAPERSTIRYTHGSAVFAINDYLSWVSTGAGSLYLAFNAEL